MVPPTKWALRGHWPIITAFGLVRQWPIVLAVHHPTNVTEEVGGTLT